MKICKNKYTFLFYLNNFANLKHEYVVLILKILKIAKISPFSSKTKHF